MKDLCPQIRRQRLSVEAIVAPENMNELAVRSFAKRLTDEIGMTPMCEPTVCSFDETFKDGKFVGVTLVQPWMESALQIHTWDEYRLLSVDVYSCKSFDPHNVVKLVAEWFRPRELVFEEGPSYEK